jgi:glucans biosynthesis protein
MLIARLTEPGPKLKAGLAAWSHSRYRIAAMTTAISRRSLLTAALASTLAKQALASLPEGLKLGKPQAFSFDRLVDQAKGLAAKPFVPTPPKAPELLEEVDFDVYQQIAFKPEQTLFEGEGYPVRLFHLGRYFKQPVDIHIVEGGQSREIVYDRDFFTYGPKAEAIVRKLPKDLGFAGFRVMDAKGPADWLAFLGVSYFRSSGELGQYGLSARGLAIDTATPEPEEFPRFTSFHLEQQTDGLVIYALLDSPSISGAFRMKAAKPKEVLMDIECRLFARKDIARLGIAPLTSMFWYSEVNRVSAFDWRPQVHDSDGLSIWTGTGERIWRPLDNPPQVMTNSFVDRDPRGFGLIQRDRDFTHYEDDGVFYVKRPTLWVEPRGAWGEGEVQLVEIPTEDEIHDNIVAYWVPKASVRAGDTFAFDYRLHWTANEPYPVTSAHVIATRRGMGGNPGVIDERLKDVKYVIDFEGGDLATRQIDKNPALAVVTSSSGQVMNPFAIKVQGTDIWRILFDLRVKGDAPVDLRAFLKAKSGEALSETWLWQHFPQEVKK